MESKLVSIIMPVFNTSRYLRECLDSVINQTYSNLEIICVDDCSTDDSLEILKEFAENDKRILIYSTENPSGSGGLPRNLGIEKATGKYVLFLDSDDYFDLELIEKLYNHAEKTNSDLVLCDNYNVISQTNEISVDGTELNQKFIPKKEVFSYKDTPETLLQISYSTPWNKFILLDTIKKNDLKFQTEAPTLDDVYFISAVHMLSKRISILNERLVYYRVLREGSQTIASDNNINSVFIALDGVYKFLNEKLLYKAIEVSFMEFSIFIILARMNYITKFISNSVLSYETYLKYFELCKTYIEKWDFDVSKINKIDVNLASFYNDLKSNKIMSLIDINKNSNIALYGAGFEGKQIYDTLKIKNGCNLTLWCDKNFKIINDQKVKSPEELIKNDIDVIIIAIRNNEVIEQIRDYLINELGINTKKIYDSYNNIFNIIS